MAGFFEDEQDREYSLSILNHFDDNEAVVPLLWAYEVGNGLVMAHRRKRITIQQVTGYLERLSELPITVDRPEPEAVLRLPALALQYGLTAYDAAYLELAIRLGIPMATREDAALRRAMIQSGVDLVKP